VARVEHADGAAHTVVLASGERLPASAVISSMPMPELVRAMDPPAPAAVRQAADDLSFRDFLTVALVVPVEAGFPDNWIYIHEPGVRVGRVQNFGSWSPQLVKDGFTCLGLEYFVSEGDDLWESADEDLVELGKQEIARLNLARVDQVEAGYVVRVPKAYPVYDEGYAERVDVLRAWLSETAPNVHPVGRNGMHRYNNQDHSMLTAMLAVENITAGAQHDVWTVNVEEDYHETVSASDTAAVYPATPTAASRTGRDAPILPRRQAARTVVDAEREESAA
jgi:protoporphyrinogen oxidase